MPASGRSGPAAASDTLSIWPPCQFAPTAEGAGRETELRRSVQDLPEPADAGRSSKLIAAPRAGPKVPYLVKTPMFGGRQPAVGPVQRQTRSREKLHGFNTICDTRPSWSSSLPFWYRRAVFDRSNWRRLTSKGDRRSAKKLLAASVRAVSLAALDLRNKQRSSQGTGLDPFSAVCVFIHVQYSGHKLPYGLVVDSRQILDARAAEHSIPSQFAGTSQCGLAGFPQIVLHGLRIQATELR
jgi:hypothetical protein